MVPSADSFYLTSDVALYNSSVALLPASCVINPLLELSIVLDWITL